MDRKPPLLPTDPELAGDFRLAGRLARFLFPKSSPACSWCCIEVSNRMAHGLGGDYFDFFTKADGRQVLLLGDVTGSGVHASVVMALVYGFIHRAIQDDDPPGTIVNEVNNFLETFARRTQLLDYYFSTTIFFGIIDPASLTMHYVNAAQGMPLVRRGDRLLRLPSTAPPIGFFANPELEMKSFRFAPGDRLLLYTDGITETADRHGELFGRERLAQVLLAGHATASAFIAALTAALDDFGAPDPPEDDCTVIVVDFHHSGASVEGDDPAARFQAEGVAAPADPVAEK